jgi:cell division protein FtsB
MGRRTGEVLPPLRRHAPSAPSRIRGIGSEGTAAMSTTARRAAPRARRVSGGRRAATAPGLRLQGIRWDRVARISLLVALLLVLLSYIGPATDYWESWQLNRETRSDVATLREDNARLRERARDLQNPQRVELEARRLGMARPGERVYVVRGLPDGR